VVVARQGGENLGVREVLEIGVVLSYEGFTEGRRYEDAGWEVGVFEKCQAIIDQQKVGRDVFEEDRVVGLSLLPCSNGGRKGHVAGGLEVFEQGRWAA
jgi:hypothetical protein